MSGKRLKYDFQYLMQRKHLKDVECLCLFSGYPRSGHSLTGALMDAHPEMVISHELDVLEMLRQGFSHRHICSMILENSRNFARQGRQWSGYSYEVPGQWQGRFQRLKVIGDKRGGRTSLLLSEQYELIDKVLNEFPFPLKMIHVVRNPFDNIVTRAMQGNDVRKKITPEAIRHNIDLHFRQADTNLRLIKDNRIPVLTIRHEEMIADTQKSLISVCRFFGLEPPPSWIESCSGIIFGTPKITRHQYYFSEELIGELTERMQHYPFFSGYSWEY